MDKIISLINSLISSKIIKDPKYIFYIFITFIILYFPKYLGDCLNNKIRDIINEETYEVLDKREEEKIQKHNDLINKSLTISPLIDNELRKLQTSLNANRTFFCEYGNSLTSLSGNLFTYFTMRNEQNASGVEGVKKQYQQQSVDNFRFNYILKRDKVYTIDDIENIKETDTILYTMLKKNGAKTLYLYLIEIDNIPKGFVGVSYTNKPNINDDVIYYNIALYARNIVNIAMRN